MLGIAGARAKVTASLLDWLRIELGVDKPGLKLSVPHELDFETFASEVKTRRSGRRGISSAELRRLRGRYIRRARGPRRDAVRLQDGYGIANYIANSRPRC